MERTGVWRASEVLAAGDTILDLEAGTNAGAGVVVGVLSGGVPRETLASAPHTHVLPSVAGLVGLLAEIKSEQRAG
jgi:phosphoglycolate phosphatase-like HAD superfamily hydrolase